MTQNCKNYKLENWLSWCVYEWLWSSACCCSNQVETLKYSSYPKWKVDIFILSTFSHIQHMPVLVCKPMASEKGRQRKSCEKHREEKKISNRKILFSNSVSSLTKSKSNAIILNCWNLFYSTRRGKYLEILFIVISTAHM